MKKLSKKSFSNCCYDPFSGEAKATDKRSSPGIYFPDDWTGNAADILRNTVCPPYDRLISFILEPDWINASEKEMILQFCNGIITDYKGKEVTKILSFENSVMLAARFQGHEELCLMLADLLNEKS